MDTLLAEGGTATLATHTAHPPSNHMPSCIKPHGPNAKRLLRGTRRLVRPADPPAAS